MNYLARLARQTGLAPPPAVPAPEVPQGWAVIEEVIEAAPPSGQPQAPKAVALAPMERVVPPPPTLPEERIFVSTDRPPPAPFFRGLQ